MKPDQIDIILRRKLHDNVAHKEQVPSWESFALRKRRKLTSRRITSYTAAIAASVALILWLYNVGEGAVDTESLYERPYTHNTVPVTADNAETVSDIDRAKTLADGAKSPLTLAAIEHTEVMQQTMPTEDSIEREWDDEPPVEIIDLPLGVKRERENSTNGSRRRSEYDFEPSKKRGTKQATLTAYTNIIQSKPSYTVRENGGMSMSIYDPENPPVIIKLGNYLDAVNFADSDFSHKLPVTVGLNVEFALTDRLAIGTGVMYSYLESTATAEKDFTYRYTQKLHYVGIPVSVSYKFIKNRLLDLYVTAGAMAEIAVAANAHTEVSKNGTLLSSQQSNITAKGLQLSVNAGIGLNVHLSRTVGMYAEPGFGHYFKNAEMPPTYYTQSPVQFNLRAGVKFQF